jgi:hypothetical protein
VSLQALPLYSVPADNVTMVTVAPTADGRIFLGGAGGWLWVGRGVTGTGISLAGWLGVGWWSD